MAKGDFEGKTEKDPEIRSQFTREAVLTSEWYLERLEEKQRRDVALWKRHSAYVKDDPKKLRYAKQQLAKVESNDYLQSLNGTIGAHPFR